MQLCGIAMIWHLMQSSSNPISVLLYMQVRQSMQYERTDSWTSL